MISLILTSIIIIIIMLFFAFVMFNNVIKRINSNAKKYFINKLDDYNDIVDMKEKQITELNEEIKELEKRKEMLQLSISSSSKTKNQRKETKAQYNFKVPKYREENFFSNYKELKKTFDFNKEDLIKDFLKTHQNKKLEKDYKVLLNFKNKFDNDAIYQMTTLSGQEQKEIIKTIMTDKEKKLIDLESVSSNINKFSITKLLNNIDEQLIKVDPIITIYVSKYDDNYDYLDPYIRTMHYDRMSEGLIIEYQGKTYDFSI